MKLLVPVAFGVLLGVGGYTFWYGQGASYLRNDPEACTNCHVMQEHYDGWLKASHHAVATCNDCHTPPGFLARYWSKAENGFWHSKGFTLGDYHEPIRIRPHNAAVLNRNCVGCHEAAVAQLTAAHAPEDAALDCLRCHAAVGHGPTR